MFEINKNPLSYYNKVKNEKHVFIFCVAGRSSSTAFQRIINSSNEVWIWGERHHIIDNTISLISQIKELQNNVNVKDSLIKMHESYKNNKHIHFYPNAIGNLDTTIDVLTASIANQLKPWTKKIRRFGYKEIDIKNIQTLYHLNEVFPNCIFLFCFRNPILQWVSIQKKLAWFPNCKKLESFLDVYYQISNIYLEFASNRNLISFIENTDLQDRTKIERIIRYANISQIDSKLINTTINSADNLEMPVCEKEIIFNSEAYKNYIEMQKKSNQFFYNLQNQI
jgi:hypothetical protein